MEKLRTEFEKTSAIDKSIGFDFQYYYFLFCLLNLREGESIGLEVKDDVHIEKKDGQQILVQLKHTVETKANGQAKSLTTYDIDLWKTLSNWSKVIRDPNDGRTQIDSQIKFLSKTEFILVTNKTSSERNLFISFCEKVHNSQISLSDIKANLQQFKKYTDNETIKSYIDEITCLNDKVLIEFLNKLELRLDVADIISNCKISIKEKMIPEKRIDETFRNIDSQIRQDNYFSIENGISIVISFEDFYKKYRAYFDLARNPDLRIQEFDGDLPDKIEDQTFIRQLVDINDLEISNIDEMIEFTTMLYKFQNNINNWLKEGVLTIIERDDFYREAKSRWKNIYRSKYRKDITESEINVIALEILDSVRKERLNIAKQELDTEMSNGGYYCLSDIPIIGWRKDWEKRYK